MQRIILVLTLLLLSAICIGQTTSQIPVVKVSYEPMHSGQISPMIYGGFIELLEDLVPGMWAEQLNDRSFEGAGEPANWCYHAGELNFCDRKWDDNKSWTVDNKIHYRGGASARLMPRSNKPAGLTQSGCGARKGMTYRFTGWFKTDFPAIEVEVALKSKLPNGDWLTLGSARLPSIDADWKKVSVVFAANGYDENAVFELKAIGSGNVWADKLSLMPTDNINGWRKDVVHVVRDSHPGLIRWGGSLIDPGGYKWKEGIGDRDDRIPFRNWVWGRNDPNDVGIDEFLQFCEAARVEPLICVCLSDGPQSAKDLVEYCNGPADKGWGKKRAENGHPKPYNVKYWQLGNELGGDEYSETCVEFCALIKETDPSVQIMSSYPSKRLLERVGKYLSHICPHHYTPDLVGCQKDIDNNSKLLREFSLDSQIKLGITEWNWTASSWGIQRAKLDTLEVALHNARYLNLLQRNSDRVEIACRSNMTNSHCSGMIETNSIGVLKRAPYHVMKLYSEHTKPIPLRVDGAPETVDVSACRTADGSTMCVFLVNTDKEPMTIRFDLSLYPRGFAPVGGQVVCDTLDRRQPDIMNHWTAPDRIRTIDANPAGDTITLPAFSVTALECSR